MGKHFKKNCGVPSCRNDSAKLIQKPFDPSRLLPPVNNHYLAEILKDNKLMLKENKRQSSLLCRIKDILAGLCKLSRGKKSVTPEHAFPQNDSMSTPYAFLINEKGRRALTKIRYEKIRACANRYNMFIDGCSMHCSKKRNMQDNSVKNILRPTGFALLKEYIENPQPMSLILTHTRIPNHLKKDELTALKYFQEARCMADFKECRYSWKCFKNVSGKA